MPAVRFPITGRPEADALLADNPFALLMGMLLDQQVPMEWAFAGPLTLRDRLGGELDASTVAACSEDDLVELFVEKPAMHRYPAAMAKRVHALAQRIVEDYDGDTASIWATASTGGELRRRLRALPGFGDEKSKIFTALLGKRFGVRPDGWRAAAGPFGDDTPRSAADVDSPEALAAVRAYKQLRKAEGKGKAD
ncbi:MAG: HhH-GPD-type base excision DNA repair protein [Desertimonas sp.]